MYIIFTRATALFDESLFPKCPQGKLRGFIGEDDPGCTVIADRSSLFVVICLSILRKKDGPV
jgi:hypothetical protein